MTTPAPWVLALGLAGTVALLVTRLAAQRVRGATPFASWGGSSLGIAAAVTVSVPFLVLGDADAPLVVGVLSALWLWLATTLLERRRAPEAIYPILVLFAAAAVVAAGLQLSVTGTGPGDAIATIALIGAVVSAWRSSQTRDGQLLGWTAAIGLTAGALAGFAGQDAAAAVGATLVGGCVGFAAYWLPPIAARLRRPGALMLGFLAVVLVLDARPALGAPRDSVIPLVFLALPLLDAFVVLGARLRGRRLDGRTTGLAGRFRARGLSPAMTTAVLVALQLTLGAVALSAGRGVLSLGAAIAVAAIALAGVTIAALTASLPGSKGAWPRWAWWAAAGTVTALAVLTVPAALGLLRARDAASEGAAAVRAGLAAAHRGDTAMASADFRRATHLFSEARRELGDPFVAGGLAVPLLAPNVRAARELTAAGTELAATGQRLTTTADPQQLKIREGTVPLAELARLEPELTDTAESLRLVSARLARVDRAFLAAPVDDAIGTLEARLSKAFDDTRVAADAARVLPAVLGGTGSQRYFLAVQNPAEARGLGGFVGSWGLITADDGKLSLDRFERVFTLNPRPDETRTLRAPRDYTARYGRFLPERLWQNVNASPDLPTIGPIVQDQLMQAGVGPVSGVITIDPVGLAHVLKLTGPVQVPGWPEPITAENVEDVTLRQAYVAYDADTTRRDAFLGDVADATWRAFNTSDLGNPARVLRELGKASRSKHLLVWFADPAAERLVHEARASGAVPRTRGDLNLVTTQNVAQNKLDVYLRRQVRYDVEIVPGADGSAQVRATQEVTLHNTAPSSGLPSYVIGPNFPGAEAGENRTFVTSYSPLLASGVAIDGTPAQVEAQRELGYWAYSQYLDLAAGATKSLRIDLGGRIRLTRGDRYTLHLVRQGLVRPDDAEVTVRVPDGWRLRGARGLRLVDDRHARYSGSPNRDLVLSVATERDPGGSILDQLEVGPARGH